jgi:type II secretory pathway pseudopilin PulG
MQAMPFVKSAVFGVKRSVTLIELLLAVILVILVFMAGIAATIGVMRFVREESAESFASDNLANTLEWIKKDALAACVADVSVDNEVTFTIRNYALSPATDTVIRYFVQNTTQLVRTENAGTAKLITDMIDPGSLPDFSTPTAGENFLRTGIWILDPVRQVTAHAWSGVLLRCRSS